MLPPAPMLAIKNEREDGAAFTALRRAKGWRMGHRRFWRRAGFQPLSSIVQPRFLSLLLLALFMAGCSPSGSRALLSGKKSLDRGDYTDAVAQLKTATSLLTTNAQAWNYLGLAYHHAGQAADAVVAYQRALALDRDLAEAHYNLGCLWLEQNKPDAAKTELTAYTLRRSNALEGWLKLGLAQLRLRELTEAEKSFSTALYLNTNNAEALNGLGLVQIQRGRPREAAQNFSTAVKTHPDYAPAILNLATVAQQYLRDNRLALQYYRAYLALTPRPANWNDVNAIAASLERPVTVAAARPPPRPANESPRVAPAPTPPPPAASGPRAQTPSAVRPAPPPRTQPAVRTYSNPPPPHAEPPAQVVQVQPEPTIVTTPGQPAAQAAPPVYAPGPAPTEKPTVWQRLNPTRWFHSSNAPETTFEENGVTPLQPPGAGETVNPPAASPKAGPPPGSATPPGVAAKPVRTVQPAPSAFPRYVYLSPREPKPGDRRAASGLFTQGRDFEQAARWLDAMKAYQQAAATDPDWFEAQYNFGVLSYRLRNFRQALTAYEIALAIRPDSVDARYNFALALKAAGYAPDAVRELEKILRANPDEVRAHLALGNLYAQQLRNAAQAQQHYLKVLALDPANPQASEIQFWLSSNPP